MISVYPKVFFIAETKSVLSREEFADDPRLPGIMQWLHHIGEQEAVKCLSHMRGSDLEQIIELAARRCYKSFAPGLNPNVTKVRTDSAVFHENILKQKHGSVAAHGHVTYAFEDVSRVFTHEVVRNSTGNDMSQESLRYVRLDQIKFWVPPVIAVQEKTMALPLPMAVLSNLSDPWPVKEMTPADIFEHVVQTCEWAQAALATYYDIENMTDFEQKKKLTSAFRRVAPEGLATGIVMTFNIRSLRWIIEQRTAPWAEEEIRIVFNIVAKDAMARWPMVFQDFKEVDTADGLNWYQPGNSKI